MWDCGWKRIEVKSILASNIQICTLGLLFTSPFFKEKRRSEKEITRTNQYLELTEWTKTAMYGWFFLSQNLCCFEVKIKGDDISPRQQRIDRKKTTFKTPFTNNIIFQQLENSTEKYST